ncbi:TetR/AcrR family transcriptional regulator [Sphingomonas glacialis]|uniref:TetR/AcrR family transcriptional regulator n=1 Tax=Sphingomonas glacialis TaxID=658225 RepID=UPI001F4F2693|nr:TetR/AcrR family transcriptional regulator [Sphingomonas glacialis]
MRYDSEHKAKTRERVLKEASAAIRLEGPDRVGVAAIMSRAGLTHGGFYAHFKSKDDLVAQAIGHMFEDRYAAFFAHLDTSDPAAAVTAFVTGYLSMRHRDAIDRGCPIPVLAGEVPRMSPDARAIFVTAVRKLTEAVTQLLENLDIPDANHRASSILSEMVGALALSRMHSDTAEAQALLDHSRRSILRALGLD